jgi:Uma2 family endonuclease
MPHLKKAELIEGRVYMAAAVRRSHGKAHGNIMAWLGMYSVATPGIELIDNTTVRLDESNEPQPDASLRIETESVGSSRVSEDDYIEGPPELAVEIAGSSASYDLHEKLQAYQRNGIQEYVVWQIYENRLDWFQLVEGKYEPLPPDADGIIRSRVFPGLHLAVESLLTGDMAEVIAVLHKGVQTKEHAAFVQYLRGENR